MFKNTARGPGQNGRAFVRQAHVHQALLQGSEALSTVHQVSANGSVSNWQRLFDPHSKTPSGKHVLNM